MTTYQLNLTVSESDPKIWRRVEVPSTFSLASMHRFIQVVMNWENSHLHEFIVGKQHYGNEDVCENNLAEVILYDDITIADVLKKKRSKMRYLYDFGDCWYVDVVVEEITPAEEAVKPRCIAGEMAGPLEDSGGIWGYSDIIDALKDKKQGLENEKTEWLEDMGYEDFDFAEFDLVKINKVIGKAKFSPAKKTKGKATSPKRANAPSIKNMPVGLERLSEFLKKQNFATTEDLKTFLTNNVIGKRIDDLIPGKKGKKSNVDKSQELTDQAMECTPTKAKTLIKQALELNPENVRAICVMGDMADDIDAAQNYYLTAMNIAKTQLGDKFFKENEGYFWGLHETRPYMLARKGYADCFKGKGMPKEAIAEYQQMLVLNPNDNQGVRYILSPLLLETKQYDDFLKLHKVFKEESTFWLFDYALYLFIKTGASPVAIKALKSAHKANKNVLNLITEKEEFTAEPSGYYSPGDMDEAVYYLELASGAWVTRLNLWPWILGVLNK